MESSIFNLDLALNMKGALEGIKHGHIRSRIDSCFRIKIATEDDYFNALISLAEYSLSAWQRTGGCSSLFHYDYSNAIDYNGYTLSNPIVKSPIYSHYCSEHKDGVETMCMNCLERYRVVTRNLINIMKTLRKDLCSIYFVDILYDLVRFENRDTYTFITYVTNTFSDGSSFKSFAGSFGKKKIVKLLKRLNRPFRRCDYKLILKKYMPLVYQVYQYCKNERTDCLDKVYDYMLYHGLSVFKHVPSQFIVVGYEVENQYRIDVIETTSVLDFDEERNFQIGSHTLLEGLNFGFYEERQKAYVEVLGLDRQRVIELRKVYQGLSFCGPSVFTKKVINSNDCIVIGFLKASENTFQNFRLDIHIESIISNREEHDHMRYIKHDKWRFEDNTRDDCYFA